MSLEQLIYRMESVFEVKIIKLTFEQMYITSFVTPLFQYKVFRF